MELSVNIPVSLGEIAKHKSGINDILISHDRFAFSILIPIPADFTPNIPNRRNVVTIPQGNSNQSCDHAKSGFPAKGGS